jgi:hypothetical protein
MKFRGYEIALGLLVATAVWSVVFLFSLPQPNKPAPEPTQQATEHKTKNSSPDQEIALYTLWLAIFTGALVAVSGIQIFFLIRTDKTARITAEAAKQSSDAVLKIERPVLYIKDLRIEAGIKVEEAFENAADFNDAQATFAIINLGRTPAILLEYSYSILDEMPDRPRYYKAKNWHEQVLYSRDEIEVKVSGRFDARPRMRRRTHLIGYFYYGDVFGVKRIAAFCYGWRDYRGRTQRGWEKVGGDQYNYERIVDRNPNYGGRL